MELRGFSSGAESGEKGAPSYLLRRQLPVATNRQVLLEEYFVVAILILRRRVVVDRMKSSETIPQRDACAG